jgi:hypothetical protein
MLPVLALLLEPVPMAGDGVPTAPVPAELLAPVVAELLEPVVPWAKDKVIEPAQRAAASVP